MKILNNINMDFQVIVVAGGNKRLYRYLKRRASHFNRKTVVFGYADNINELMSVSSFIISKPGGITISESFAKSLPVLIVRPIPGQEQMNTTHLVKNKVAIRIKDLQDLSAVVKELLSNRFLLESMRCRARAFSKPNSALDIARIVLEKAQ